MCSLTWDECNIESDWRGSVVLKRRFLLGFKIFFFFLLQNCENFTPVPLFSPAQLHFVLAYSVKTCRLFSSYSSRRSSKENTHKAAAGTGIGRGSGYILFFVT